MSEHDAGAAAERENVPDSSAWNETGGDEIVVGREFHPEFVVGQERDRQARSEPESVLVADPDVRKPTGGIVNISGEQFAADQPAAGQQQERKQ